MDLFLISLLILFLELACIRWFPAHVLFLTFFTNTVLLACFVGMSVGCLAARSKRNYLTWTPFLLVLALAAGHSVEVLMRVYARRVAGLEDVWIARMDATLAAVTPRLVYPDGSPQLVGSRVDWETGEQAPLFAGEIPYPTPVGVNVIGTALLLRADVLREVGGFDPRFFAYREAS